MGSLRAGGTLSTQMRRCWRAIACILSLASSAAHCRTSMCCRERSNPMVLLQEVRRWVGRRVSFRSNFDMRFSSLVTEYGMVSDILG